MTKDKTTDCFLKMYGTEKSLEYLKIPNLASKNSLEYVLSEMLAIPLYCKNVRLKIYFLASSKKTDVRQKNDTVGQKYLFCIYNYSFFVP